MSCAKLARAVVELERDDAQVQAKIHRSRCCSIQAHNWQRSGAINPVKSAARTPLNVLLIEDSEDDAALAVRALSLAGYDVRWKRVASAESLCEALDTGTWDLAIADYTMPGFTGTRALAIVREHDLDLPFIFVSGTIGEETAVAAMRTGAHDYIIKGSLARLAPAVERELRDAAVRRERTLANERVTYLAYHDPLTELPNRALLQDRLEQAILTSKREKRSLALLVVDLDGFKAINDALGHHAGDRVLQQVASRMCAAVRHSDTVARLGGDEFAVLLQGSDLDGARLAAQQLLCDLQQPFVVDGRPFVMHASIGIAGSPLHGATTDDLLQKADIAMYLAKGHRSGYMVYSPERDRSAEQRLAMATAINLGISGRQFVLDYQPLVQLATGAAVGLEALLRWEHPQHGRLLPGDFIHVAERTGVVTSLTALAIETAIADWRDNGRRGPLTIAVNLSPKSLDDRTMPVRIRAILDAAGYPPSCLVLEITENAIMADPDRAIACLRALREMGIRIVLDDFGTGYSSLSYLRRLPIDELKIDQSFIIGLAAGEDCALVKSIIDLAHNLRLGVVAEGVETEEARDILLSLGCDTAQGYFICRPAAPADISAWLATRRATPARV
jgi:diguanylate cyclase (GGDEF)-like protein